MAISVAVVDDHRSFAQALGVAIDAQSDLTCVFTCVGLTQLFERLPASRPDVVVLDHPLPEGSSIAAISTIRDRSPATKVLIVTSDADAGTMTDSALAGAAGYLPKECPVSEILDAVRAADRGVFTVAPSAMSGMLMTAARRSGDESPLLSPREVEVLAMLSEGMSATEISKMMRIGISTTRGHIQKLFVKFGVHSQLELVVASNRNHAKIHDRAEGNVQDDARLPRPAMAGGAGEARDEAPDEAPYEAPDEAPYDWGLTPRQRSVAVLSARGLTAGEVAGLLGLSPRTVEAHLGAIQRKTGMRHGSASLTV